jgi:hypothetical protein
MEYEGQDIDLDAQPPITELIQQMDRTPLPEYEPIGEGADRPHPTRGDGDGGASRRRGGADPDRGGGGDRRGRDGGGRDVPMCTGAPEQEANPTLATQGIRRSATQVAYQASSNVPEELVIDVGDQIRRIVRAGEQNEAVANGTFMNAMMGMYRWTIRANVTRTQRCAEPTQHRRGTITQQTQDASTTTDRARTTDTRGVTVGAQEGADTRRGSASATASTARERERTTGGTTTQTTTVAGDGAYDTTEEQWDYHVDWTVTAELDADSFSPINVLAGAINAIAGWGPLRAADRVDIGTQSITRTDTTPPPRPRARTPRPRGPQPIVSGGPDPEHGPRRVTGHGR